MTTRLSVLDVRSILTAEELAAAQANVDAAPPLNPEQLDVLGDIFRPTVQQLTVQQANP
ncbi:hypothetical protein JOF56_005699 [Kibdelosporangium banguiense]|uniref:FXSXX-COOH protein n=1 Tax=Kibdelosporangium banguiense TaxID=1365924 RepID=A0ABS4TMU7_9PSEU|nr:hypothetical protein [Kibdelosporangium banguiense]MBP2325314.1 hypothetical protein [Kibdelosporangium banguiense]